MKRSVVDAKHHLWDTRTNSYPWLNGPPYPSSVAGDVQPIAAPYLAEDFRRDTSAFDVIKTVHVDAGCSDPLGETRWLAGVAARHGFPNAIVAGAKLEARDFAAAVEKQLAFPACARFSTGIPNRC
jgi:predicted TIM-barrel fold metal-dependent hydrolase